MTKSKTVYVVQWRSNRSLRWVDEATGLTLKQARQILKIDNVTADENRMTHRIIKRTEEVIP